VTEAMWPTLASLYVEAISPGGESLGGATATVVRSSDGTDFLVTARHVFTGLHHETEKIMHPSLAIPEKIRVYHRRGLFTVPEIVTQELYDHDGDPLFRGDPSIFHFETADVAALQLVQPPFGAIVRSYEIPSIMARPGVTSPVWIIGYPAGSRPGGYELAVWSRGSVATDPVSTWHGDRFLVDSRTRSGQSGSPVIVFIPAHVAYSPDGQTRHEFEASWTLLGVYSGRLPNLDDGSSDLGSVWNVSMIRQILEGY
jgi:hypothetical protein